SGAVAGVVSTLLFTWVHDLIISDIWFSLPAMLIAGVLCGAGIGGSFAFVVERPKLRGWIRFNLILFGLFVALALTSVLVYSPITTVAALIAANEAPTELIREARPLLVGFVVLATLLLGRLYSSGLAGVTALLATILVLTVFLGINVAIIGLVSVTVGTVYLIVELFALIALLAAAFAATFLLLERRILLRLESAPGAA
ncbi:MAG: hypothetical protein HKN17_11000, partial [Rhodothermales bacterium]|nr:hypothetical protein [Rhodothermales bacterium]